MLFHSFIRRLVTVKKNMPSRSKSSYPHISSWKPTYDGSKPMYKYQAKLPMLPVPALEETCEKYLKSLRPLLKTPEERQRTESAVKAFLSSPQAAELQGRLVQRRDYRDPVVINVSYFFHFQDDRRRMKQTRRAASLLVGAMEFRDQVLSQSIEADTVGRGDKVSGLCMHQYQYMFNSCRVPAVPADAVNTYDPKQNHHIAVMRKGKVYVLDAVHPNGKPLNESEFEVQLDAIKRMADQDGFAPLPIGALTSENRDKWTESHKALWQYSEGNQESLKKIESSVLMICLDDTNPVTRDEVGRALWHGDGRNRWYDKTMEFIVFENGKAGYLGEHAMMDATPLHRMAEHILERNMDIGPQKDAVGSLNPPQQLVFHMPESIPTYVQSAISRFESDVARHDHKVLAYEGYGKDLIKKFGVSPDTFVQLSIQLAFYKLFGESRATYESAQTKKYAWGRTEVCRSCSDESVAWTQVMQNASADASEKVALARKAAASHSSYMAQAVDGRGVDRHLLGLRMCLKQGEQTPSIFTDPAYKLSSHWSVSTSQITSEYFDGWGWGEVVPDGFGIAYMIKDRSVHYNVAALKGGPGYEAGPGSWRGPGQGIPNACQRMTHLLQESLHEMRAVFEADLKQKGGSAAPKAKL